MVITGLETISNKRKTKIKEFLGDRSLRLALRDRPALPKADRLGAAQ